MECLDLVLADRSKPWSEAERAQRLRLWSEAFKDVPTEALRSACLAWMREHTKGFPTVGELTELVRRSSPPPAAQQQNERLDVQKRFELKWVVAIMEGQDRYRTESALESVDHYLRRYGYSTWRDAKAWLVPGWAPSSVTEVYLSAVEANVRGGR